MGAWLMGDRQVTEEKIKVLQDKGEAKKVEVRMDPSDGRIPAHQP